MATTYMHLANETVNMVRCAALCCRVAARFSHAMADPRGDRVVRRDRERGVFRRQFKYMTTEIKEPFLRPEIVDRLTGMLNYNLAQLVGPKCTDLKVGLWMCGGLASPGIAYRPW